MRQIATILQNLILGSPRIKLGAFLVLLALLWTFAEAIHLVEWLVGLPRNEHLALVRDALLSPLGTFLCATGIAAFGIWLIYADLLRQGLLSGSQGLQLVDVCMTWGEETRGVFAIGSHNGCLLLCNFYNGTGTSLKKISAVVEFSERQPTTIPLPPGMSQASRNILVRRACWVHTHQAQVSCKDGGVLMLVLAYWPNSKPQVLVPENRVSTIDDHELPAGIYSVLVKVNTTAGKNIAEYSLSVTSRPQILAPFGRIEATVLGRPTMV